MTEVNMRTLMSIGLKRWLIRLSLGLISLLSISGDQVLAAEREKNVLKIEYNNGLQKIINEINSNSYQGPLDVDNIEMRNVAIEQEEGEFNLLLKTFPRVNSLTFWNSHINNLKELPEELLNHISTIQVASGSVSPDVLAIFSKSINFKTFENGSNAQMYKDKDLEFLRDNPTLSTLELDGNHTDAIFETLKTLLKLKAVTIYTDKKISSDAAREFDKQMKINNSDFQLSIEVKGENLEF